MRFLKYIFCALLFVTASVAETININWMNGDETYALTTCTVGGDLILPETPTKRGYTFKGWAVEYTRLEYIESTGTQYIDTRINPHNYNKFKVKTSINFGTVVNYFGANYGYWFGTLADNHFTIGGDVNTQQQLVDNTFKDFEFVSVNQNESIAISLKVNNETITRDYTKASTAVYNSYYINGISNFATGSCNAKIKTVKIYGDDVLIRNLIPAKRNSDSVIGMYDTVSGRFFTNAGTGEFIAGPVAENQSFSE